MRRALLFAAAGLALGLVQAASVRGRSGARQRTLQAAGAAAGAGAGAGTGSGAHAEFFGPATDLDQFDEVPSDTGCPLDAQQAIVEAFTPASIACERSLDVFAVHPRIRQSETCSPGCRDALHAPATLPRTAFACMGACLLLQPARA
jgi:hypothetical protein